MVKTEILISFEIRQSRLKSLDSIAVLCYELTTERVSSSPLYLAIFSHLPFAHQLIHWVDCCIPDTATAQTIQSTKQFARVLTFYVQQTIQLHLNFLVTLQCLKDLLRAFGIDTKILISRLHSSTFCHTNRK